MSGIRVSIVLVVTAQRGYDSVFATLDSLRPDPDIPHEIVCVDAVGSPRLERLRRDYPGLMVLEQAGMVTVPAARNLAIRHARGEYILFTDDHVEFPPTYLADLIRAFECGTDVVGGSVYNANPETLGSWAHYFAEYSKWLAGIPYPDTDDLPGSNWAARRTCLERMGGFRDTAFGLETQVLADWRKRGVTTAQVPSLLIGHVHVRHIRTFWPHCYAYGRWYAANLRLPLMRRLLRAAAFPVVAAVLFARTVDKARQRRDYLWVLAKCSPLLLTTFLIRAAGEAMGHLAGPPAAPEARQ